MNKKNRKGFTIVELVIVIAVIGILATVLVPTFGNVISDAKNAGDLQKAKNIYTNYVSKHVDETKADGTAYETQDVSVQVEAGKFFIVTDGVMAKTSVAAATHTTIVYADGSCTETACSHQ